MSGISRILTVCWNVVQTITFWDLLDILIIAYVIYRALTFVSRTNSSNIIKGIIAVIAVLWLSSILHLRVVNYLIGKAFEMGILVLIILFQSELRSALGKMGSTSKLKWFFKRPDDPQVTGKAISQVVMACEDMSRTMTGALIVFEKDLSLENCINTGTKINADPSADLIKTIFFHNSPLHDGAVIIRDGRIAGASCMLPLSSNTALGRELGMRHRAGVGMSERSDAAVAIVSEETGAISLAVDGMLKRHLTPETLEKALRNELIPPEEARPTWRSMRQKKRIGN
ncbi:MAG: diadenylate cyclase CdaA [Oscillospiraceae bacterium]|nr:diadenylate cyclase CdaA [Oscillospiraceae bacterium]